jgi:hypothetical protein
MIIDEEAPRFVHGGLWQAPAGAGAPAGLRVLKRMHQRQAYRNCYEQHGHDLRYQEQKRIEHPLRSDGTTHQDQSIIEAVYRLDSIQAARAPGREYTWENHVVLIRCRELDGGRAGGQ